MRKDLKHNIDIKKSYEKEILQQNTMDKICNKKWQGVGASKATSHTAISNFLKSISFRRFTIDYFLRSMSLVGKELRCLQLLRNS